MRTAVSSIQPSGPRCTDSDLRRGAVAAADQHSERERWDLAAGTGLVGSAVGLTQVFRKHPGNRHGKRTATYVSILRPCSAPRFCRQRFNSLCLNRVSQFAKNFHIQRPVSRSEELSKRDERQYRPFSRRGTVLREGLARCHAAGERWSPELGLVALCLPRIISTFAFKGFKNDPSGSLENNLWAA